MNGALHQNSGKWKLILLALLFAAPVILSTLLYTLDWRPRGAVNYGELVQPPRQLSEIHLREINGGSVELRKKWTLVYFAPPACTDICRTNLYKMRQVHAAQGQERDRVQRVMIVNTGEADWLASIRREHPDLHIVTMAQERIKTMAQMFALPGSSPLDRFERIYVVDPLGNFMMSFPPDADPSGMRKDLKRLLKVSQIG